MFCCKCLLGSAVNICLVLVKISGVVGVSQLTLSLLQWGWELGGTPVICAAAVRGCWYWAAGQQPPLCLPQTTALLASQWAAASVSAVASCLIASVLVNMFSPSLRSP